MKATELRIGNYIDYTTEREIVTMQTTYEYIRLIHNGNKNFKPIPLTEEWFYNFGFIIFNSSNEKGIFIVNKLLNPLKYSVFGKEIKYVHELQNWYFLMTNEELTLTK